jgi:hypothetical protein
MDASPEFEFIGTPDRRMIDLLLGTKAGRQALEQGDSAEDICADWSDRERAFAEDSKAHWLYPHG